MPLRTSGRRRFVKVEGRESTRSWAGIPLLVEGEVIGLLSLDRYRVDPFGEEDLHRAKAVVFSAAAAIRKAQLLEQIRRYAALMERVVAVDQAVFAGDPAPAVGRVLLEGAISLAESPGGLLVLEGPKGPRVAAARGEFFDGAEGRPPPRDGAVATTRLGPRGRGGRRRLGCRCQEGCCWYPAVPRRPGGQPRAARSGLGDARRPAGRGLRLARGHRVPPRHSCRSLSHFKDRR